MAKVKKQAKSAKKAVKLPGAPSFQKAVPKKPGTAGKKMRKAPRNAASGAKSPKAAFLKTGIKSASKSSDTRKHPKTLPPQDTKHTAENPRTADSLRSCPKCKHKVSKAARTCPDCGHPMGLLGWLTESKILVLATSLLGINGLWFYDLFTGHTTTPSATTTVQTPNTTSSRRGGYPASAGRPPSSNATPPHQVGRPNASTSTSGYAAGSLTGRTPASPVSTTRVYRSRVNSCRRCMHGYITCPKCHGKRKIKCPHCHNGRIVCPRCHGRKIDSFGRGKCPKCDGQGTVVCKYCKGKGVLRCPTCKGRGRILCPTCRKKH